MLALCAAFIFRPREPVSLIALARLSAHPVLPPLPSTLRRWSPGLGRFAASKIMRLFHPPQVRAMASTPSAGPAQTRLRGSPNQTMQAGEEKIPIASVRS